MLIIKEYYEQIILLIAHYAQLLRASRVSRTCLSLPKKFQLSHHFLRYFVLFR